MKYSELKEKSQEELEEELKQLDLKMNEFHKNTFEKTFKERHKKKVIRRDRARILTLLSELLRQSSKH